MPKAIQCFQAQRYRRKELLILADGEDVRDLVPDADNIRLLHINSCPELGDKRNFGCEQARGEVVIHWDDDDWSAPERVADQIGRMQETGKAVTGYHSMRFTDGTRWWKYIGTVNYSLGTSLCYRREYWSANRFPPLRVGEDNKFVSAAWSDGQLATADAGDLMYATIHPGNTSPRTLGDNWKLIA